MVEGATVILEKSILFLELVEKIVWLLQLKKLFASLKNQSFSVEKLKNILVLRKPSSLLQKIKWSVPKIALDTSFRVPTEKVDTKNASQLTIATICCLTTAL